MITTQELIGKEFNSDTSLLVTGGAGFIGSDFVKMVYNLSLFKKIYVVDKLTYASDLRRLEGVTDKVELIHASIEDVAKYRSVLTECEFVVNFAAESHVDRSISDGRDFIESNILGSYNLLEVCREFPKVSLLHVSTDEVYGSFPEGEADEISPIKPSSTYSASKAASDQLALANFMTHSQKVCIARCSNNYGPFQHSEKFIPRSINQLLLGRKILLYGSGLNQREWIFVSDHNSALLSLLSRFKAGDVFNIGSGFRITNLDLAKIILSELDLPEDRIDFIEDRKGHDFRYALNSKKIRSFVGWKCETSFERGIASTVNWYRNWFLEHNEVYK